MRATTIPARSSPRSSDALQPRAVPFLEAVANNDITERMTDEVILRCSYLVLDELPKSHRELVKGGFARAIAEPMHFVAGVPEAQPESGHGHPGTAHSVQQDDSLLPGR